jgi:hypothetical protein
MKRQFISLVVASFVLGFHQATAQSFVLSSTNIVGMNPFSVLAADINGDGKMDLVSGQYGLQTLTFLTNNGNGTFSFCSTNGLNGGAYPFGVVSADFNGDGKSDVVCLHEALSDHLTMLTNDGTGYFCEAYSFNTDSFPPTSICAADVNGDGNPDLIVAHSYFAALTILTNDGLGNLVLSSTNSVGSGPVCVVAVDVNGDHKIDLITANQGTYPEYAGSITVLTNDGSGSFVFNASYAMPTSLSCLVAADVNGDGHADLITANADPLAGTYQGIITVLTNNGGGVFGSNAVYVAGQKTASLAAADMNGDGKMDLICANGDDNNVMVLTNDGRGIFAISSTNSTGPEPLALAVADLTGDGKPDVICANSWNTTLTVLLNSPPRPLLNLQTAVANCLAFSWSAAWPGFALQQNSDLGSTNWLNVSNDVETIGGIHYLTVEPTNEVGFFRLVLSYGPD